MDDNTACEYSHIPTKSRGLTNLGRRLPQWSTGVLLATSMLFDGVVTVGSQGSPLPRNSVEQLSTSFAKLSTNLRRFKVCCR